MTNISKMKKHIIILTTFAALLLGSLTPLYGPPGSVEASSHVQQAQILSSVNFRTSPSSESSRYGTIPSGAKVQIVEEVNSDWLKVNYKGRVGYISSLPRFVQYKSGQANDGSKAKSSWEKKADKIILDGLKLRGAPYRSVRGQVLDIMIVHYLRKPFFVKMESISLEIHGNNISMLIK
jgi:hypothetical protein